MIFDNILYRVVFDYIKKEPYTGSYQGMRFRIWKSDEKIITAIYKDEFCFEKTSKESMTIKEFEATPEDLEKACDYIENAICTKNND